MPFKLRNTIDKAVIATAESQSAEVFLSMLYEKLHELLSENVDVEELDESKGLNYDRGDTREQMETILKFFPQVLSEEHDQVDGHALVWQAGTSDGQCNLKAVQFIPLFAELGISFNSFEDDERGGLITDGCNLLESLCINDRTDRYNEKLQQRVDGTFLNVLQELRKKNLFQKKDIREYELVNMLCDQKLLPIERFRYLVDWDPNSLIPGMNNNNKDDDNDNNNDDDDNDNYIENCGWFDDGSLPLHRVIESNTDINRGFRTVFEAGMDHHPIQIGGMFHNNGCDDDDDDDDDGNYSDTTTTSTPFQMACAKFGIEETKKVLTDGLDSCKRRMDPHEQQQTVLKSLLFAATSGNVHLDGVFTLVRREPSLCCLLPTTNTCKRKRTETKVGRTTRSLRKYSTY